MATFTDYAEMFSASAGHGDLTVFNVTLDESLICESVGTDISNVIRIASADNALTSEHSSTIIVIHDSFSDIPPTPPTITNTVLSQSDCIDAQVPQSSTLTLTEPVSGDTLTLKTPDWAVHLETKWIGHTVDLLDGESRPFGGYEGTYARSPVRSRKYPIKLETWEKMQAFMLFVRTHVGKTIEVTGYYDASVREFILDMPQTDIKEVEMPVTIVQGLAAVDALTGATAVRVTGFDDTYVIGKFVRFWNPLDTWFENAYLYRILDVTVISPTVKELSLATGLAFDVLTNATVAVLNRCGLYSTTLTLSEVS